MNKVIIKRNLRFILGLCFIMILASGCSDPPSPLHITNGSDDTDIFGRLFGVATSTDASNYQIEPYTGNSYVELHNNIPQFTEEQKKNIESFEHYSDLDSLGRCQSACACLSQELMPTESRGDISEVKPAGWHSIRYDIIEEFSLYNRCHLIAFCLAGENANEKNLITGTDHMNKKGMLPFENMVAAYIDKSDNHVLYRVTPVYQGDNLIADGVIMEAYSVEDSGKGICFNIFVYNIQPGVEIDYATGDSWLVTEDTGDEKQIYVLNIHTMKLHRSNCESVADIAEYNKKEVEGSRDYILSLGYEPCKRCNP